MLLGAGRRTTDDRIDPAAGLVVDARVGDVVAPGDPPRVVIHHDLAASDGRLADAHAMLARAFAMVPVNQPFPTPRASRILEVLA